MKYLEFPLKWFSADLESIKKVKFYSIINGMGFEISYFGSVKVENPKEYKFKKGQIGWEVKYINKRTKKEIIQIWTKIPNFKMLEDKISDYHLQNPNPCDDVYFGMVLSTTREI